MIAVFALGEGIILAQQDEVPILKPKAKPVTATTLMVMCDLACNWKLDGEPMGRIDAGGSTKAKVELGQHEVAAVTEDGLDKIEKEIEIKAVGQTIFHIELQLVRDARLKAELEADPNYVRKHAAEWGKEGQNLYDQHREEEAKPLLEKACNGGEMAACVTLGAVYDPYGGLSEDNDNFAMARSLYLKGCDSGVMRGCARLGFTYQFGPESKRDLNVANRLFQKACDGGDSWGCNGLGVLYEYGEGVIRDIPKARALYQKACLDGLDIACDNLRRLQ
jgi:hypothetical protein